MFLRRAYLSPVLLVAAACSSSSTPAGTTEQDAGQNTMPVTSDDAGATGIPAPDAQLLGSPGARTLTVTNNCRQTLWVTSQPSTTFPSSVVEMAAGDAFSVGVANGWSGAIWAKTYCTTMGDGMLSCQSDPSIASRAEFTLAMDPTNGQDAYDVSLVDGFNVGVEILAVGHSRFPQNPLSCGSPDCNVDLTTGCPGGLAFEVTGQVLGCANDGCQVFGDGGADNPNCTYPSTTTQYFKEGCPQAVSYPSDTAGSAFTCAGRNDYEVVFCPPAIP